MLKGLTITPPILGRISIGKIVDKNGKRLPEKDDQFTITSQIQSREGWLPHPYDEGLRKAQGGKIRSIPIRLMFNGPELNFRAEYTLFDRNTGRPLCVGNGETCRRRTEEGIAPFPCPSPDGCMLAKGGACKPYGRLNVVIGDDDPLGSFIFRTTGFNSIRTLAARLHYFQAISGNLLSCLPLELRLRGKSTLQSYNTPIYYVDITVRSDLSMEETLAQARQIDTERKESGFDQNALDHAARLGLSNGAFEDSEDEGSAVIEEFFPVENGNEATEENATLPVPKMKAGESNQTTLVSKLEAKAQMLSDEVCSGS